MTVPTISVGRADRSAEEHVRAGGQLKGGRDAGVYEKKLLHSAGRTPPRNWVSGKFLVLMGSAIRTTLSSAKIKGIPTRWEFKTQFLRFVWILRKGEKKGSS